MSTLQDLRGRRYGHLEPLFLLDEYPIQWLCWCDCGVMIRVKANNLRTGNTRSCGGAHHRMRTGRIPQGTPTYRAMHQRLRRHKGRAAAHTCVDCGEQAWSWSYDGADPQELRAPAGYAYSTDESRYVPRCRPCHKAYDKAQR